MTTQEPRYLAYMLRLWQVRDNDEIFWRASLEDAHTGARRRFANLDDFFKFLVTETHPPPHTRRRGGPFKEERFS